ncbi:MAG: nicotinate-nucleotide adenylyltransferase [Hyphomicrobiales bacterium]|nr:nicotinate-nucleotide adenylyltransferase [Hyphomicrobiales bacterium]
MITFNQPSKDRDPFQIPPASRGLRIGLFGGSFNPPHRGHLHVSLTAIRKLRLDQLWWLVTPGNPLKQQNNLPDLKERLLQCQCIARHPAIKVTAFEASYNFRYSADTISLLKQRRPTAKFVWVMGADNLANFHKWDRWHDIVQSLPLAIIDRPDSTAIPNSTSATHFLAKYRMDESDSIVLADSDAPAWTFIHARRLFLSSTQIRDGIK